MRLTIGSFAVNQQDSLKAAWQMRGIKKDVKGGRVGMRAERLC